MARQAITTKYLGPTNYNGSRIKAKCYGGSITIPLDYSLDTDQAHAKAAKALAEKMGWGGHWFEGGTADGTGNVYVSLDGTFPEDMTARLMDRAAFSTT